MTCQIPTYKLTQLTDTYTSRELSEWYRAAKDEAWALGELQHPDAAMWADFTEMYRQALALRRKMDLKALPVVNGRQVGVAVVTAEMVKDKADIVHTIERFVELRKAGRYFKGLCPFHSEKTPSFYVFPDKQGYHCFGCDKGGDIIDFLIRLKGVTFTDALKELAAEVGIRWEVPQRQPKHAPRQTAQL